LKKLTLSLLAMSVAILMITSVYASCMPKCTGKVTGGGQIPICGGKAWPLLKADFTGPCTLNHLEGYRFWVYVEDDGEPSSPDFFRIKVWDSEDNVVYQKLGDLLHGNIQIHKPPK
jgi:hypothetical protein